MFVYSIAIAYFFIMAHLRPCFEVHRLEKTELVYLLRARGSPTTDGTILELRAKLRALCRLEGELSEAVSGSVYPFSFEEDLAALEITLAELKQLLPDITVNRVRERKKFESKIAYAYERFGRLTPTNPEQNPLKIGVAETLGALWAEFNKQLKSDVSPSTHVALDLGSLSATEVASENESDDGDDFCSPGTPPAPVTATVPPPIIIREDRKTLPARWGLKFSGDGQGLSLNSFLERVSDRRLAECLSESDLLRGAIDLFEGPARMWFRQHCRFAPFVDWKGLVIALRREFLKGTYDEELYHEILNRRQLPTESIGMYLSVMCTYFDRISTPVPEANRLQIIIRNLAPFYQNHMIGRRFDTISEFRVFALGLEDVKDRVDTYSVPSGPTRLERMEPDLVFKQEAPQDRRGGLSSKPRGFVFAGKNSAQTCEIVNPPTSSSPAARTDRYCFRCKLAGYTVLTCPRCNSRRSRAPDSAERQPDVSRSHHSQTEGNQQGNPQ